ncbi:MAG: CDP-glycerol glycerophosphotransferase family protein [Lachnospiraceae bacterium]|nr:CDP-glycerol glycerophosphotransferase family protein [Lachnospiraceae bacterium]
MILLYIDPGTGSMLFALFMGIFGTLIYFCRVIYYKVKFYIKGGRGEKPGLEKIPYVIYSDDKRYWNTFEPICDYFEKKGLQLEYWTASEDDPGLDKEYNTVKCRFIGEGNKGFVRLNQMKAGICLSTTPGLDVYQWKRSKDVNWYVHIFHGASQAVGYRMFGIDFYDAVLTTGPLAVKYIRLLEEMREIRQKELQICGCTYMDEMLKRKEAAKKPESREKTVLLAPTWGKSGIFSRFGGRIIDALLETKYHIIIRPHPQSLISEREMIDGLMKDHPDSERIEWNFDNDNFDVLCRTDILISDFSGVVYDYTLVFDKPVIYADTSFDPAPYDIAWTGEDPYVLSALKGLGVQLKEEDLAGIGDLIEEVLQNNNYSAGRDAARSQVWSVRGDSARRISEYMIGKYREITGAA